MTDALYLDDKAIAQRLGVSQLAWLDSARVLTQSGLPQPDPLFGGRRYWPAVRAFLDRRAGLAAPSPRRQAGGVPNWEGENHAEV